MIQPEIYTDNAVAMTASVGRHSEPWPGISRIARPNGTRLILRHEVKLDVAELLDAEPRDQRLTIEDSFSSLSGEAGDDVRVLRMPVMVRPAEAPELTAPATAPVSRAVDAAALADAERIIVDGFPVVPNPPSPILPQSVLLQPEWKVWLAHHDGVPAAAGYTYDNGVSAGVYLLATLPEHRSAGLGRAIMTAAIAAHPNRHIALVATDAGAPLYRSLSFVEVATATWYIRAIVD
jgi:GNAT superfamily N-acetyltransferase